MLALTKRQETVAILFGGRSSEHEISLRSAAFVLRSVPKEWRIIPVGITHAGKWLSFEGSYTSEDFKDVEAEDLAVMLAEGAPLSMGGRRAVESLLVPAPFDVASSLPETSLRILNLEAGVYFPVLHGTNGEDGRLQAVCDLAEVAYVGPDQVTSAIGMDKSVTKRLAEHAGVPTLQWREVSMASFFERRDEVLDGLERDIGFPAFIKPNALGSAVGVSRARNREELIAALEKALSYDERALVEVEAHGTEVECAYLGTPEHSRISQPGEIAPEDFYSYDEKYSSNSPAALFVPARLDAAACQRVRTAALQVARALHIEGLCRIDFWWRSQSGEFFFNEVNTLPGMTSISMFPKLWDHEGLAAKTWIAQVLDLALVRLRRRLELRISR
jgi:D-alanine-D-alanine ligase